ncbi:GNAT family N-acetyltransferase [Paenibacillus agilis]|uniref:GNAT family N-acetyltransferase n=1 Tax=Paenibacillus agilis TaxID=3020863 RepID=A0A559J154_9BACL|nr:GNAT family N-acetyltransferase [Paenibacillus agilis]TVX93625.1 GNAT family N-acetyltransferase [Paenibacillus agilis]
MHNKQYEIIERRPTVLEHKTLWEAVGWGNVNIDMTERSIDNSVYAVVVISDDQVVGMGRIVGDGAMYYYIQDVAVLPDYQKLGIGQQIVDKLMQYIRLHCVGAGFVGLFASQGEEPFYEKLGFKDYSPGMTGMFTVIEK